MKLQILAIGAFALAAACAPTTQNAANAAGPAGRDCFNSNFISGYGTVGEQTVRVSASPSKDYDLDIEGPGCRDITWTTSIAIVSKPSAWICVGDKFSGDIKFRDTASSRVTSCYIKDVRRYVKPAASVTPPATQ
jgi:hypothetical protein